MFTVELLPHVLRLYVTIEIGHIVSLVVAGGARLQQGLVVPHVLLQLARLAGGEVAVEFRTGELDPAVDPPVVLLQLLLVLEDLLAVLAQVDDFIVLLQHVCLQGLPLPALIVAVLALQPVGEDPWLLLHSRGEGQAVRVPQLGGAPHLRGV